MTHQRTRAVYQKKLKEAGGDVPKETVGVLKNTGEPLNKSERNVWGNQGNGRRAEVHG